MQDYKQLVVWQRAMTFAVAVYQATRSFPTDERFGLTNQLRRCAVSIASNIAEGQGRRSKIEFGRFLRIANGSRQEAETQVLLAAELKYLDEDNCAECLQMLAEIGRLLSSLIKSLAK